MGTTQNAVNEKLLCYIQTPYSLLATFCYLLEYKAEAMVDLVIVNQFGDAKDLADRLRASGRFGTVLLCNPLPWERESNALLRIVKDPDCIASYLSPELDAVLEGSSYDGFITQRMDRTVFAIINLYLPDAAITFIDDGIGSHNGSIFISPLLAPQDLDYRLVETTPRERLRQVTQLAFRILTGFRYDSNIGEVALFHPVERERRLCKGIPVTPLHIPTGEGLAWLLSVFDMSREDLDAYRSCRCIFLLSTDELGEESLEMQLNLLRLAIQRFPSSVGFRLHPRSQFQVRELESHELSNSASWELLCAMGAIDGDHMLVSVNSTAMKSPNMLDGSEPALLFLYELIRRDSYRRRAEQERKELASAYTLSSRVYAPKTFDQALACLTEFIGNR